MKYFSIFVSILEFFPFVVGLLNWKRLDDKLKMIFYLVTIACLINSYTVYLFLMKKHNAWLIHIYTILEFFLIAIFYYKLFERITFKRIVIGLMIVFGVIVTINKIYLESFEKIDNYSLTISAILLLIISSMYLVEYLINNLIVSIRDYRLLLTVGFMVYFGANLFIFALSNDVNGIWLVHNVINTLLILVYTIVFYGANK
jgi:hypothetical protein